MQTLSCGINPSGGCESPPDTIKASDPVGRRIYIHEESFTDLARQGTPQAVLIYRMAARNIVIKAAHHAEQDAMMLGLELPDNAIKLADEISSVWSETATWTLQGIAYRPGDPRLRSNIYPVIESDEEIYATCYFSNYYTFATGKQSADMMFADTNEISAVRKLMTETDPSYADMSLLNGNCLFFIEPGMPLGVGVANQVSNSIKKRPRLSSDELNSVKKDVFESTRAELDQLMRLTLDQSCQAQQKLQADIHAALRYAFTRGILKVA